MKNREVFFNIAEEEWLEYLQEMGATRIQACETVIQYKREMAHYHEHEGNYAVAEQLLKELGEWEEGRFPKKIILPGEE